MVVWVQSVVPCGVIITGSAASLPAGVTLQAPDGGLTYYANNGFTFAVNMGMDSPSFFPIGPFDAIYDSVAHAPATTVTATQWVTLGWNTAFTTSTGAGLNNALAITNGIPVIYDGEGLTASNIVGFNTADEPDANPATAWAVGFSTPIGGTANADQDHRFWYVNFTWNWYADSGAGSSPFNWTGSAPTPKNPANFLATPIATPNAATRFMNMQSIDVYWFSSARAAAGGWPTNLPSLFGGAATLARALRGTNYGDVMDVLRSFQNGAYSITGHPAPLISIIETGQPFDSTTIANFIRAEEINWAVWGSIIHGSRAIMYFDHNPVAGTFFSQNAQSDNPSNIYTTLQNGSSVTVQAQIAATDALIASLAPVINANFAIGYASVSPAGYSFPTPIGGFDVNGAAVVLIQDGIDICVHYYTGGGALTNGFYIFATTRNTETDTNIIATFTIKNTGATIVTVINESRTINITGGGTTFTDTFAKASTVHIYQIT